MTELLQAYSTQPHNVRLSFGTVSWNSTPGIEARRVDTNALTLTGSVLLTKCDVPGVTRKKADQFKKKTQLYALTYRSFGSEGAARAGEDTPNMTGVLSSIPDCPHSHLVLELNVLAYLLKLPAAVALGCYVYTPDKAPELITVQRVPELTQQLLNDAYVRRRLESQRPIEAATTTTQADGRTTVSGVPIASGAALSVDAPTDFRTGRPATAAPAADGDPAHYAPPSGAAPVQQVRRRVQQQELF